MNSKQISKLEQQIMLIIWSKKECSIKDVWEELSKQKKLAYNTVGTVLQRLINKGLLTKKLVGTSHIYKPKVSRESYLQNVSTSFIKTLVSSYGDIALASFAEGIDKLPKEKREYLINLIEKNGSTK